MSETRGNHIRHKDEMPPRSEYLSAHVLSVSGQSHRRVSTIPKDIALAMLNSSWYREFLTVTLVTNRQTGDVVDMMDKTAFRITPSTARVWQLWSRYDTVSYPGAKKLSLAERQAKQNYLCKYIDTLYYSNPDPLWVYKADGMWYVTTPIKDEIAFCSI